MDQPTLAPVPAAAPRRASRLIAVLLVLLAVIVAALWFDTRGRIDATQDELARRLRDIESESREARSLARQAQEGLRDAQAKIGALEAKLAESQNQQVALEALYQELARNRDEWQLAEIEQVLAIAQQQLQLSGNVRAALLALQLAESRLSRADRPQFLPVRRALARDIERLKALPSLDVPGLSLALDRLAASVDALPLAFDERIERVERTASAKSAKPGAAAPEEGFLKRFGGELWRELRQLIEVRRVDSAEPPLRAAAAGLVPAREPETAPPERARVAADARRSGLPRGPAHGAELDPALLRRPRQGVARRAGPAQAAVLRVDQLRAAEHRRQPRSGARLQGARRAQALMRGTRRRT